MHTSRPAWGASLSLLALVLSSAGCDPPEPVDGGSGLADGGAIDGGRIDGLDGGAPDGGALDGQMPTPDSSIDGGAPVDAGVDADVGDAGPMPIPGADPTFGTDGVLTLDVHPGGGRAAFSSIAIQADGKLVASGRDHEGIVVARALPSGALDPAFGRDGLIRAPLGRVEPGFADRAGGVAIAPDGSVVVGSYANIMNELGGGQVQAVFRYRADGRPDRSFGDGGRATTEVQPYPGNVLSTDAVAVQPDGRIVVVGTATRQAQLRRFLPDGEPDESFGTSGRAGTTFGADYARAQSVALQPDGRIVVGGARRVGAQEGPALARFTSDGALDVSFAAGAGYFAAAPSFGLAVARGLALRSDGGILLGWHRSTGSVGRFDSDGSLDASFGTEGWSPDLSTWPDDLVELPGGDILITSAVAQVRLSADGASAATIPHPSGVALMAARPLADGRIASAGYRSPSGTSIREPVFAMQLGDGTFDETFGSEGVLVVPSGGTVDRALAIATQADGKILIAGASGFAECSVARITADGALDPTFGDGGVVRGVAGVQLVTSIAVDASGAIVLGGFERSGLSVARLSAAGAPDASFGVDGVASVDAEPAGTSRSTWMTLAPDGTILVAGVAERDGNFPDLVVARLTADGALDASFGDAGIARVERPGSATAAARIVVQPDGAILALVGTSPVTLARFLADGTLDPSFGTGGIVEPTAGIPTALAIDGSGRIVLVGMSGRGGDVDVRVQRYLADGTADATFGTEGEVVETLGPVAYPDASLGVQNEPAPMGLILLPSGEILVAAATSSDALTERALLLRLTEAGDRDESFGAGGRRVLPLGNASSSLYAAEVDGDGRILLAGRSWTHEGGSDFTLVRLE